MSDRKKSRFTTFVKVAVALNAVYAAAVASLFSSIVYGISGIDNASQAIGTFGTVVAWLSAFIIAFIQGGITIAVFTAIVLLLFGLIAGRIDR